jgi:hypothetical protein
MYVVPSTSPPRSAVAFLAVRIAPFPKTIFCCDQKSARGARLMGGNLISVSDPPFKYPPGSKFLFTKHTCLWHWKVSTAKAKRWSWLIVSDRPYDLAVN